MLRGAHKSAMGGSSEPAPLLASAAASRIGALLSDMNTAPWTAEPAYLGQPSRAGSLIFLIFTASALHAAAPSGSLVTPAFVPRATAGSPREVSSMNRTKSVVSMAGSVALSVGSIGAMGSVAAAQDAVQWRIEDGGNGHWYAVRLHGSSLTWHAAKSSAEALGGHLVAINSNAENQWVRNIIRVPAAFNWFAGPWLGGYQDHSAPDYAEPAGGWRWVTGEPWFSAWMNPEPNGDAIEDYLHMAGTAPLFHDLNWNDLGLVSSTQPIAYLVEWSADCNADGIVDFGQIRTGALDDANANNIPDCCESGAPCACDADITGNGTVDGADLAAVLNAWSGASGGKSGADVNRDGAVDGQDLALVLGSWGSCG